MQLESNVFTEWIDCVFDEDLQSDKGYHTMVLRCPECGALFKQKACGNRTIFPFFGFHPTDGNVSILSDEFRRKIEMYSMKCDCPARLERITEAQALKSALNELYKRIRG